MTKKPAKIRVRETQKYWGEFEGSLESIIHSLQSELDDGWEGVEMEYERDYGSFCPHEAYYLYKHRLETDKEYEKRMKGLEKKKAAKLSAKEKRRKQYEQLREEFGND